MSWAGLINKLQNNDKGIRLLRWPCCFLRTTYPRMASVKSPQSKDAVWQGANTMSSCRSSHPLFPHALEEFTNHVSGDVKSGCPSHLRSIAWRAVASLDVQCHHRGPAISNDLGIILFDFLPGMWFIILARIKVNPWLRKGPLISNDPQGLICVGF